jgi:hypothetical protein
MAKKKMKSNAAKRAVIAPVWIVAVTKWADFGNWRRSSTYYYEQSYV